MKTDRTVVRLLLLAGMVVAVRSASAEPLGTGFTYQGQLKQGGVPVNHTCDFDVGLWTAEAGGTELGMHVVQTEDKNGLFTLKLNEAGQFGANAFNGDRRWLEIAVSCPAGGSFVPLGRQELTPAPYAMHAAAGGGDGSVWELNGSDIYYNNGNVGIGILEPSTLLHLLGNSATLTLQDDNGASQLRILDQAQTLGKLEKINSSGQAFLDINPVAADGTSSARVRFFRATDTTGIKAVEFLRGDLTTNLSARIGVDGADSLFQLDGGNVGIGTPDPQAALDIALGTEA